MGLFCVNLHFQTTDETALSASLDRRGVTRYRVIPAKNGWTSLYEERASQQDDEWIRDLAGKLSHDLHVAAIAFLVHDSDIACYWLFDDGRLLDEYNSCPDYFDADGGGTGPSGGQPDVLIRYCQPGIREDDLAAILGEETVFADSIIESLAAALGIGCERALASYRDIADGEVPAGIDESDDGDDDGGSPDILPLRSDLQAQFADMIGIGRGNTSADPQVTALVQAAASDDTDAIDKLLAGGVAIDATAPAPLPSSSSPAGLGLLPGGMPKIAMTPLLAAVVNKRRRAAERLLDGGADPNQDHPLFGTPVHTATSAGDVDMLQLLIGHGGDVNARNLRRQTPLQVLAASRATKDSLIKAEAMMKTMGMTLPGLASQLSNVELPTQGWDACERLLKSKGAR